MSVASSTSFRTYVKQKQGGLERQIEKMRRIDRKKKWIKAVRKGREFYENEHVENYGDQFLRQVSTLFQKVKLRCIQVNMQLD